MPTSASSRAAPQPYRITIRLTTFAGGRINNVVSEALAKLSFLRQALQVIA